MHTENIKIENTNLLLDLLVVKKVRMSDIMSNSERKTQNYK